MAEAPQDTDRTFGAAYRAAPSDRAETHERGSRLALNFIKKTCRERGIKFSRTAVYIEPTTTRRGDVFVTFRYDPARRNTEIRQAFGHLDDARLADMLVQEVAA